MSERNHQSQTQRHQQTDQADTVSGRKVDQVGQIANGFVQVVERRREHGVKPRRQSPREE